MSPDAPRLTSLPVRMGRTIHGEPLVVDFVSGGHWLIAGETRSGKSVATYVLTAALAEHFATVRVVGIDPTSVVLGPFQDRFPDKAIVTGTGDIPACVRVVDYFLSVMEDRLTLLRQHDSDAIRCFSPGLPLIAVVLEELPALMRAARTVDAGFKPADRLAPRLERGIERLLSEGAKVGFRVVALMQRPDAEVLGSGYARAQLTTRVGFRMSDPADLSMLFKTLTPDELSAGTRAEPGVGYVRTPGTVGAQRFRTDYVPSYRAWSRMVRQSGASYYTGVK